MRVNGDGGVAGGVVLGGDYVGLGIARSLGRRGVPVCLIDDERSITRFSRFTTHAVRVPTLRDDRSIRDTLLGIGDRLGLYGWVLFPTRDELVAGIARTRADLTEVYRVPMPGWRTIEFSSDKRRTYDLAAELGIPAPRTWRPRTTADLAAIDGPPPWVVKPAIKEHFFYATGAKAWRADDPDELARLFALAQSVTGTDDEVMIQELIPGDGECQFAWCGIFKDGRSLASMVARRRRQHPPDFGRATTFAETVDIPVLEERSERLLRAIDFHGLLELEYKRDPRDGEYKLLDFNARAWGYHTLGPGAGVDFPYLLWADQTGKPFEPRRAVPGVRWMRLTTDLPTAIGEVRARRLTLRELGSTLAGDVDVEAVFSRDDPAPGMAELALLPYLAWKHGLIRAMRGPRAAEAAPS